MKRRGRAARIARIATLTGAGFIVTVPAWGQRVAEDSFFAGIAGSGARALGMAGAFIAIADDATAASWNPAGLCVLEKPEAAFVGQPISNLKTSFSGFSLTFTTRSTSPGSASESRSEQRGAPYEFEPHGRSFDFAAFTYPFRIGTVKLVPQISYQRVVDLGLDYEYTTSSSLILSSTSRSGSTFSSSISTRETRTTSSGDGRGGIDLVAGSLGISFTPTVYLGVAVNRWFNGSTASGRHETATASDSLGFSGSVPTSGIFGSQTTRERTVEEDFEGWNFHVGALFKPFSNLSVGVVYKHPFEMEYAYRFTAGSNTNFKSASSSGSSTTSSRVRSETNEETTRNGTIRWPRAVGAGIVLMPWDFLSFAFDYTRIEWSDVELKFGFVDAINARSTLITSRPGLPDATTTTSLPPRTTTGEDLVIWPSYYHASQPENGFDNTAQVDARQLRLGVEYVIRKPDFIGLVALPLRAGLIHDQQYFKNTGDLSRVYYGGFTGGLGFVWSRVSLDFAYVHVTGNFNDDYTTADVASGTTETFIRDANNDFLSQRLYVSAVIRF